MLAGRFTGTMALSEPQAGSSLADIVTRAEPADDGTFALFGSKMWISGAEHEMSENIVHLVLAKIPGPDGRLTAGTQGIDLRIGRNRLLGLPLPGWLGLRGHATERVDPLGRFSFDVAIDLPFGRRLIRYRGWLA